jgi:hypothetical protein
MTYGDRQNSTENKSTNDDYEYFLTSELPLDHARKMLEMKGMSQKEIDVVIDKLKDTRDHLRKVVRKFINKIQLSYSHLDLPELLKKGMKHAEKYGFKDLEKTLFRKMLLKGDTGNKYTFDEELNESTMSRFLGFNNFAGQMIKIEPKDQSRLNELHVLFDQSKHLHSDVKTQALLYQDCAIEATSGKYDRTKHIFSNHIHPIIVAMFLNNIEYFNRRMLFANIARIVLSRSQAYLKNFNFHSHANIAPGELDAEMELAFDIAHDPNALSHLKDENPLDNIIKRYRCQIELFQTVMKLRAGNYYSSSYDANDGVMGLKRLLDAYEWNYFDSPDYFAVQDEGTLLRKLLAIFSLRPTFTRLDDLNSTIMNTTMGFSNLSTLAKTVFITIPIVNVRMPITQQGVLPPPPLNLRSALRQTYTIIEHKFPVLKQKEVIFSRNVVFFYANRRTPVATLNTVSQYQTRLRYMPMTFTTLNSINTTRINYAANIPIGTDLFTLRSIVCVNYNPDPALAPLMGCSAIVVSKTAVDNRGQYINWFYDPLGAAAFVPPGNNPSKPFEKVDEFTIPGSGRWSLQQEFEERGVIFMYEK